MSVTATPQLNVSKETLMFAYKDFHGAKEFISRFFNDVDRVTIFDHLHFGYAFSSALYEVCRVEDYKKFVLKYNETTKEQFAKFIEATDELFTTLGLYVNFTAVLNKPKFFIEDQTNIFDDNKFKLEKDLEENIYEFMKFWSNDWKVNRQKDVGYGKCDIVLEHKDEIVAIELKKGKSERKDVYQAIEYSKGNSGYKPILIAHSFDENAIELAREYHLNCYEYAIGTVKGLEVPRAFYPIPAYDFAEETLIDNEFEEIVQCDGFLIEYSVPASNIAHELANEELKKSQSALSSLNEYVKSSPKSNICPCCKTDLSKRKEVI